MARLSFGATVRWIVLILFAVWTIVPIALVVINSFKTARDIFDPRPDADLHAGARQLCRRVHQGQFRPVLPQQPDRRAGLDGAGDPDRHLRRLCADPLPAGGADTIAGGFLVGKLVPTISMLLPLFVIINAIGLRGTLGGPIIAHTALNLPFVVWLMMGFIRDVPRDLLQAAMIDGCSRMQRSGACWCR